MGPRFEDFLDQRGGVVDGFFVPSDEALGRPVAMLAMALRPVFFLRSEAAFARIALVAGHALALEENLNSPVGTAYIDFFAHELIVDTITVLTDLYIIVDIDRRDFPFRQLVARMRQRFERGFVQLGEQG